MIFFIELKVFLFSKFCRSLWNIAHGFTGHLEASRPSPCLLQYDDKGVQTESNLSPIKLKQLFVPFLFLICGWILGILQFLREKMHAHFRRQRIEIQQRNVPVVPPVIEVPLTITDIEMEPETAPEIPKQSRIDLIARTVSETPPVATPVAPTAIESPPSDYDISSPVVVKKSNPPVKPKTSATKLPPSDPNTTSHPVPTTKSIAPVNPSTPVITALPSNASPLDPLAIIDISNESETDSDDEEIELKPSS